MHFLLYLWLLNNPLFEPGITLQWGGSQHMSSDTDAFWLIPKLKGQWRYRRQRISYMGTGNYNIDRNYLEGYRLRADLALNLGRRLKVNVNHRNGKQAVLDPLSKEVILATSTRSEITGLEAALKLTSYMRLKSHWNQQRRSYGLFTGAPQSQSHQDQLRHDLEIQISRDTRLGISHNQDAFLSPALSETRRRRHLGAWLQHRGGRSLDFQLSLGRQEWTQAGLESWTTPFDASVTFRPGWRLAFELQAGRDGFDQEAWSLNGTYSKGNRWQLAAHFSRSTRNSYTQNRGSDYYVAEVIRVNGDMKLGRRWNIRGVWQEWKDVAFNNFGQRAQTLQVTLQGRRHMRLFGGFYGQDSPSRGRDERWEIGLELKKF